MTRHEFREAIRTAQFQPRRHTELCARMIEAYWAGRVQTWIDHETTRYSSQSLASVPVIRSNLVNGLPR